MLWAEALDRCASSIQSEGRRGDADGKTGLAPPWPSVATSAGSAPEGVDPLVDGEGLFWAFVVLAPLLSSAGLLTGIDSPPTLVPGRSAGVPGAWLPGLPPFELLMLLVSVLP